jgi:hypothetical protein
MSKRNSSASFTGILFFAGLLIFPAIGKSYNLTAVNGMQAFQGSAEARELFCGGRSGIQADIRALHQESADGRTIRQKTDG